MITLLTVIIVSLIVPTVGLWLLFKASALFDKWADKHIG